MTRGSSGGSVPSIQRSKAILKTAMPASAARRAAGSSTPRGRAIWQYPTFCPTLVPMRKTSVYLDDEQAARLARLARREGRSQAEILREAVATYEPPAARDRGFEIAAGFPRTDGDSRPISQIPDEELLQGFGR